MTRHFTPARAVVAAALGCAATVALAQLPPLQATFTLVSPALPYANEFSCTVTNVSSQAVTLNMLLIVFDGTALPNVTTACTGTLASGAHCTVTTPVQAYRGAVVPHCRARYATAGSSLVVGSMRGSYINVGTRQDIAVLPLQPLQGVTLSTYQLQP